MRITAFTVIVPDYDAGLAFYVQTLGFRLIDNIDQGRKRWITVQAPGGGPQLVLARAENATQQSMIGNQGGGRVWLFLETDDFARDYAHMLAIGISFEEEPRHETYGIVAVWRDPFGNRWDLLQRAQ
jgi:catechol 2,3-dioxygenase-like lactoylglutathione lyase family enzyme